MRLLHTSDWHIGRTFHGQDILAEQEAVLQSMVELVRAENVDVVLISGDLYDRAVPSAEAVAVCTRGLAALRAAGAELVVTAGNHDSAPRLGAFSDFAAAGGLHLRTRIADIDEPVVVNDEHGAVAFYGIPYLEPETARRVLDVEEKSHTAVLTEAMNRIRADLNVRATRSVVLAHAFVTGAQPSESERSIAVGGVEQVPAAVFDGVDYVAMGHLHGPQVVTPSVRYSGSPMAYSFSEAKQRKSVWLVDFDETGLADARRHPLPVPRPLTELSGELADVLSDEAFSAVEQHYVSVTLTDEIRPVDPMRSLRTRFPYAMRMQWQPAQQLRDKGQYAAIVRGRSDDELADAFIDHCRGGRLNAGERDLVRTAFRRADQHVLGTAGEGS